MPEQQVFTNKFSNYKWIVDTNGLDQGATHTTIAGALSTAVSGESIFVKPGQYTEDLTLKAGVNIVGDIAGFTEDFPEIVGKLTATDTGTHNIIGFKLTPNSDFGLVVSGSNSTIVFLHTSRLRIDTNTYLNFTNSNVNSVVYFDNCLGRTVNAGNTLFVSTSVGVIFINYCNFAGDSTSIENSTISAGEVAMNHSLFSVPIQTTGTASIRIKHCNLNPQGTPAFIIDHQSTLSPLQEQNTVFHTRISAATRTSPAINIGAGAQLEMISCIIGSENVNPIVGTGTLIYSDLQFDASGNIQNTISQVTRTELHGAISFDGGSTTGTFLDNYEQGTWTPVIFGLTTPGVGTYTNQVGQYTRIGNRVSFNGYVVWSAHTGTGTIRMTGLPFTSQNVANAFSTVAVWFSNFTFTAGNSVVCYVDPNDVVITMNEVSSGAGSASIPIDTAASFMVQGNYQTEA